MQLRYFLCLIQIHFTLFTVKKHYIFKFFHVVNAKKDLFACGLFLSEGSQGFAYLLLKNFPKMGGIFIA